MGSPHEFPLRLAGLMIGTSKPLIVNLEAVAFWLHLTKLRGWIEDRVLKVRRADVEELARDRKGWRRQMLEAMLENDELPKLSGHQVELV